MTHVEYKQGMTKVWCDGEKIVITNLSGTKHIKENVERIFGVGEYDKIYDVKYSESIERDKMNSFARNVEIISGYIPKRAELDLQKQNLSETSKSLTDKYFTYQC